MVRVAEVSAALVVVHARWWWRLGVGEFGDGGGQQRWLLWMAAGVVVWCSAVDVTGVSVTAAVVAIAVEVVHVNGSYGSGYEGSIWGLPEISPEKSPAAAGREWWPAAG
nr:hypothetical protein [Tanacetum cinerariifolium]